MSLPSTISAIGINKTGDFDVIEKLDAAGLLPAITFIFSRAGCDAAVTQCMRAGMRLTTEKEREEIRQIVDRRTADLAEAIRLLRASGSLDDTFARARLYGQRAIDALGPFANGRAKDALVEAVEFAVARAY